MDPETRYLVDEYVLPFGLRLAIALAIFYLGRLLARALLRGLALAMERSDFDVSVRKFLGDVMYAVMMIAVIIAALDTLGVRTTAVIAVLGAAGLAIGLALQGSLSNCAAGVMLIVLRPYRVGDVVVIGKYGGRVDAIRVFQTTVITADNREIQIPNGQIIAAPIENLTSLRRRRIDLVVHVPEMGDIGAVKQLLEGVVAADARVLATPAPSVEVAWVTDAGVRLVLRPWTDASAYDAVAAETMEKVRAAMAGAGLRFTISLPQAA
ncbi:MAG: mechanosensitive ion channel [Deltaproteobacteria bacterium]|nr:mechanosensitive ion channel [Deltaproteobacteria bacterium]